MKTAFRKLNSKRGVSLLMGLLLLVVVIIVAAVVLSAALTSAQVKKNTMESQQDYLTVSSAVDVFVQELSEMKFTAQQKACYAQYGEQEWYWLDSEDEEEDPHHSIWNFIDYELIGGDKTGDLTLPNSYQEYREGYFLGSDGSVVNGKFIFADLIKTAVNFARTDDLRMYSNEFTVKVGYHESKESEDKISSTSLDPVTVSFSMDSDFNFTAVFSLKDPDSNSTRYAMTVKGSADLTGESFNYNENFPASRSLDELLDANGQFYKSDGVDVTDIFSQLQSKGLVYDEEDDDEKPSFSNDGSDSKYFFVMDRYMTLTWETITVNKGNTTTSAAEEEPTT